MVGATSGILNPEVLNMKEHMDRSALRSQTEDVASATECTGLVPVLPGDEGEDALRSMYAVQPAKRPEGKRKGK